MDAHGVVVLLVGVLGVAATAASSAGASSPGELSPAGAGMGAALGMLPLRVAKRYDLDLQTCVDSFDVQRDQIIRTQDSKRMGAVNLAVKDVLTRDECLRLCCETDKCDVFVFEEKQSPGTCYMFHCGPPEDSRCKFTRHESYSTGILDTRRRILDQHEQDLSSLRILLEPTPAPMVGAHLLSSKTGPLMSAAGSAVAGGLQLQQGAGPLAPSPCSSEIQFQCRHTATVECIAIYNKCDGIPQCSDNSDEANCPAATTTPVVLTRDGQSRMQSGGAGPIVSLKVSVGEEMADPHMHAQELMELREQQYQLQRQQQQQQQQQQQHGLQQGLLQAQQGQGMAQADTKPQSASLLPQPPQTQQQQLQQLQQQLQQQQQQQLQLQQQSQPQLQQLQTDQQDAYNAYRSWAQTLQPQQQTAQHAAQQAQHLAQLPQLQQGQQDSKQLSLSDQLGQLQQPASGGSGRMQGLVPNLHTSHQAEVGNAPAPSKQAALQPQYPRLSSQPEQEQQLQVQQQQPQQQQQDILAAALQQQQQQQQQLFLQQQQLLQQQQQQIQQQQQMFQRAGVAGPARGTGPGAGSQWDAGANPFRPGVEHNSHIFTHKGGVLDSDHYHHNHPHQMFGDDLQNTGAAGYGDALRGTSGAAGPYYGQGNANARPSDDYPPLRTGAGPLGGPGPQRGSPAYGGQYGAQPDYFYEDGGSESRLQIGNIGRLQGLPVSAADDSGRRIEADLTSVPYERQLSPQQPAQQQPAQQQLQPAQPQQPAQQQPAASAASPAAPTAAPAASPAQGAPSPTLRPRPQDKPNSVKKQLEHAKPADKSTVPPLTTVTVKPSGETPTRNQTEAVQQKPTSTQIGSKKASGGLAPSVSSGSDANLSLEQAALVDITDGPTVSPKGAVISLVLGMVLTSFMVVVIVCRVRMIKRKLLRRGGQSSYAHDADYLVNGMYL